MNIKNLVVVITGLVLMCCSVEAQSLTVVVQPPANPVVDSADGYSESLVADATPANGADGECVTFDWADPDGDWGQGDVSGMESVLSYYPEGDLYGTDDDVTCTVTDGVGDTDMDDAELYVPLVQTTTWEHSTDPDTRTTIGIGEQVDCKIAPSDTPGADGASWSNSGDGTLDTNTGSDVTYTAYVYAEDDTITVQLPDGSSLPSVTLNVILPQDADWVVDNASAASSTDPLGCGMTGYYFAGPDNVNFYNCGLVEGTCAASTTGCYSSEDGLAHGPSLDPVPFSPNVSPGYGTGLSVLDTSEGEVPSGAGATPKYNPPYNPGGTFDWPIPVSWVCGPGGTGGVTAQFDTAYSYYVVSIDSGGATATINHSKTCTGGGSPASPVSGPNTP